MLILILSLCHYLTWWFPQKDQSNRLRQNTQQKNTSHLHFSHFSPFIDNSTSNLPSMDHQAARTKGILCPVAARHCSPRWPPLARDNNTAAPLSFTPLLRKTQRRLVTSCEFFFCYLIWTHYCRGCKKRQQEFLRCCKRC